MGMDGIGICMCSCRCLVILVVGVMCLIAKMFMKDACLVTFLCWSVGEKWRGGDEK